MMPCGFTLTEETQLPFMLAATGGLAEVLALGSV